MRCTINVLPTCLQEVHETESFVLREVLARHMLPEGSKGEV